MVADHRGGVLVAQNQDTALLFREDAMLDVARQALPGPVKRGCVGCLTRNHPPNANPQACPQKKVGLADAKGISVTTSPLPSTERTVVVSAEDC